MPHPIVAHSGSQAMAHRVVARRGEVRLHVTEEGQPNVGAAAWMGGSEPVASTVEQSLASCNSGFGLVECAVTTQLPPLAAATASLSASGTLRSGDAGLRRRDGKKGRVTLWSLPVDRIAEFLQYPQVSASPCVPKLRSTFNKRCMPAGVFHKVATDAGAAKMRGGSS